MLAAESFRCEGLRFRAPAMTSEPSRWVWKKVTPSVTSLPYKASAPPTVNDGELPAALPATLMWYVPGAFRPLKTIG